MAITNPEAIGFSDQKLRVAADLIAQLDNFAATVVAEWNSRGMAVLIPNTSDVLRDDASPTDDLGTGGDRRPVVTGAKLHNIINRLTALRSTDGAAGLALGVAGVRDTVLQVAVKTLR